MPKPSRRTEYRMVKDGKVEIALTPGRKVALEYEGWQHEVAERPATSTPKPTKPQAES